MLSVESFRLETLFASGRSIANVFVLKYGVSAVSPWKTILTLLVLNLLLLVVFEKISYAVFVNFNESNFNLTVTFEVLASRKLFINLINNSLNYAFVMTFKHHIFSYSANLILGSYHWWHAWRPEAGLATIFFEPSITTIRLLSVVETEFGDAWKLVSRL